MPLEKSNHMPSAATIQVVLYQPEIPPNTGNIIRLCANSGALLHIVEPCGFKWDDRQLRRAGLDYHEFARVARHPDWAACEAQLGEGRRYAITTKGQTMYHAVHYRANDVFVFGPETRGLPEDMLATFPDMQRLRIPMLPHSRSLNLSNATAVIVYEAWRQLGFAGGG